MTPFLRRMIFSGSCLTRKHLRILETWLFCDRPRGIDAHCQAGKTDCIYSVGGLFYPNQRIGIPVSCIPNPNIGAAYGNHAFGGYAYRHYCNFPCAYHADKEQNTWSGDIAFHRHICFTDYNAVHLWNLNGGCIGVSNSDRNICYHIHGNSGIPASCLYEAKRYFVKNELTGG